MTHVYRAFIDIAWRHLSSSFRLRAEDFAKTENVQVLARILLECNLTTGYMLSRHETNGLADDAMMYGTVNLPCHSFTLRCLSALQFTHYIWIGNNGDTCHVVGPSEASAKAPSAALCDRAPDGPRASLKNQAEKLPC